MGSAHRGLKRLVWFQMVGFLVILTIIVCDELFDFPHLFFGAEKTPVRMEEYLIEGVVVFCLAVIIIFFSLGALRRVKKLESYLIMCAWCRRVKVNESWIPIEEYLKLKDEMKTTHGICKECAKQMKEDMKSGR